MTRASALIFHFSKEITVIEINDEFSEVHGWNLRNQVAATMVIFIFQFERNGITANDQISTHFQNNIHLLSDKRPLVAVKIVLDAPL